MPPGVGYRRRRRDLSQSRRRGQSGSSLQNYIDRILASRPGATPSGSVGKFPSVIGSSSFDPRSVLSGFDRRGSGPLNLQRRKLVHDLYRPLQISDFFSKGRRPSTRGTIRRSPGGRPESEGRGIGGRGLTTGGPILPPGSTSIATPSGDISTAADRRTRVNAPRGGDPEFGEPQTPLDRALRYTTQETALELQRAYRELADRGIFGEEARNAILAEVEGPERLLLEGLSGRTSDLLSANRARGQEARRRVVRGAVTPRQRPGVAASILAQSAIPIATAESEAALGLEQEGFDLADRISLNQGQRRADLLQQDESSKAAGLAGLSGSAAGAANIINQRLFDASDPLGERYKFESGLNRERFENQLEMFRRAQQNNVWNAQQSAHLQELLIEARSKWGLWAEQKAKEYGLGDYDEDASDYIDAFMPDTVAIGG